MVANITSIVTRDFVPSPIEGYTIESINELMINIAYSINGILEKIRDRGFNMEDISLKNIDNITQVTEVLNENINMINKYFSDMNETFAQNYMLNKEVLETMKIDVANTDAMSTIVVFDDRVDVELDNGQIVSVKKNEVTSVKGNDTQTIAHA